MRRDIFKAQSVIKQRLYFAHETSVVYDSRALWQKVKQKFYIEHFYVKEVEGSRHLWIGEIERKPRGKSRYLALTTSVALSSPKPFRAPVLVSRDLTSLEFL